MPDEQQASNWLEEAATQQAEKPVVEEPVVEESTEEPVKEKVVAEKVVPLGALHESRAKERQARQEAQAARSELEQFRRQYLESMQRQQQATAPQAPDKTTDPVGNITHTLEQTQAQLADIQKASIAQQQEALQRRQFEGFVAEVRTRAEAFTKEQPDANDGINFLKKSRVEEYKAMGMTGQEAQQRMLHDELQLSQWAMGNGENPAQVAYNMAIARGYVAPDKKLDMQSRGQGASMPAGSGGKGGSTPSLEALLKMDSKDFAKATSGDNWEKLMKKHGA